MLSVAGLALGVAVVLSVAGLALSISSCTLQLFVSQHLASQEVILTEEDNNDNLFCASVQMRFCVVVQLKRDESEAF